VLIRQAELQGILEGAVDLAFRRWTAARVLSGTRLRTAIGLVEVTSLDETTIDAITPSDATRAGFASLAELVSFLRQHPERPVFRIGLRYAGPDPRVALREDRKLSDDDQRGSGRGWTASTGPLTTARGRPPPSRSSPAAPPSAPPISPTSSDSRRSSSSATSASSRSSA
jgi:hypothetical protein